MIVKWRGFRFFTRFSVLFLCFFVLVFQNFDFILALDEIFWISILVYLNFDATSSLITSRRVQHILFFTPKINDTFTLIISPSISCFLFFPSSSFTAFCCSRCGCCWFLLLIWHRLFYNTKFLSFLLSAI